VTRVERVFVDTNTLYPISITDLVLRLAEAVMFDLIWSDHLLAEVERVLVERKGLRLEAASYFCDCARRAFPDGRVAPKLYLPLGRTAWSGTTGAQPARRALPQRPRASSGANGWVPPSTAPATIALSLSLL